ncbi:MAG: CDP-alcohol phosphatidyltransferase family protein [Candidatus Nanopelagicales bacterium]
MLNNADARGVIAPVVEPIARALLRMRITPDMVTLTGTVLTVLTALILIPAGRFVPALVLLALFVSADVLDGTMARLTGTQGPWGAWFDATLDRVADGAIFGGLLIWAAWSSDTLTTMLAWVCLVGGAVISYAKARAEAVNATANGGIAERAERMILLAVGAILQQFVDWGMTAALGVLSVLTVITVFQRGLDVRSQLRPRAGQDPAAAPADPER